MNIVQIDPTKGYHQVLSIVGASANDIAAYAQNETNQTNTYHNELAQFIDTYKVDGAAANLTEVNQETGETQTFTRLIDNQTIDSGYTYEFSETLQPDTDSRTQRVTTAIEGVKVQSIENEIENLANEVLEAKEELSDLDVEYESLQERMATARNHEQDLQQNTPSEPAQVDKPDTEKATPTAGHVIANSIARFLQKRDSQPKFQRQSPSPVWNSASPDGMDIRSQCQRIDSIISSIKDPKVCVDQSSAKLLIDDLGKQLVKLNQSVSRQSKKVFSSEGMDKQLKAGQLAKDMEMVDKTLANLGKNSEVINGVMEKFDVKFDMKAIQESIQTMMTQLKSSLQKIIRPESAQTLSAGF